MKLNKTLLFFTIVGFISIYLLNLAFLKGTDLSNNYPPRENAIISIQNDVTISHLLLEEFLSGDSSVTLGQIKEHVLVAQKNIQLLKYGGKISKRDIVLEPINNQVIINQIDILQDLLKEYKSSVLFRAKSKEDASIGSELDKKFDVIYRGVINSAKTIEDEIIKQTSIEIQNYKILKIILFLIFIVLLVSSIKFVLKNQKILARNNKDLLKVKEELSETIKIFNDNVIASSTDSKGNIIYASDALCKISGYSQEELLGKQHNILRHPDMPSEVFKDLWATIKSGKPWEGEIKNRKKDGEHYWVRTIIRPDFDEKNNIIGYSSIRHDITPQKAKEEFMANMSHELRTPLNAIIGFSNILLKKLSVDSNIEMLKHINSSSMSLLSLINDILDLSKIKNAKFSIEPYEFNAYTEIGNNYNYFLGLTENKNINLEYNIDESLHITLLGDWDRINQIILNVISNSVKFTPKDGLITFDSNYDGSHLNISVKDNGIGMTQETLDKIFLPFEQADGSTTRKYGGTGLGLSITQSLVELMNGSIAVESKINEGTIFTIKIPLQKIKDTPNEQKKIDENVHENIQLRGHVLVAEDNEVNQMLMKMILDEYGVTCDIVNDGQEALDKFDPNKHKLVLMDESMPNMNGVESMKAIRKKHTSIDPIIISITANAMVGDKEKFLKLGMNGYIAKPINKDELFQVLKKYL